MGLLRLGKFLSVLGLLFTLPLSTEAQPGCANTKEPMRSTCQKLEKRGVKALSCYRSAADQQRLRNYFYGLNPPRRGQVARGRSRHQLGVACDFNRNLGNQYEGLKRLNSRSHRGNHYSDTGH